MSHKPANDVSSIDGVIRAMYDCISGPAGPRDWEREKHLFLPGGRLMAARPGVAGGKIGEVFDVHAYIDSRAPFFDRNDFYEVETDRRVFEFGAMAHVLSAYEGRSTPDGPANFRGINSIQLFDDGTRWWVLSILWDNERTGNPMKKLPG